MQVRCSACGKPFEAERSTAKFCGGTCRQRANRREKAGLAPVSAPPETPGNAPEGAGNPLVAAVTRELAAVDRLDTVLGQQAVRLAEQMGNPFDTGSALAAVNKELTRVMELALKDAVKAADPIDELEERRLRKAAGG